MVNNGSCTWSRSAPASNADKAACAASRAYRWASQVLPDPGPPSTTSSGCPSNASDSVISTASEDGPAVGRTRSRRSNVEGACRPGCHTDTSQSATLARK